jgi:FtsZ-binding cell division protein ZapB
LYQRSLELYPLKHAANNPAGGDTLALPTSTTATVPPPPLPLSPSNEHLGNQVKVLQERVKALEASRPIRFARRQSDHSGDEKEIAHTRDITIDASTIPQIREAMRILLSQNSQLMDAVKQLRAQNASLERRVQQLERLHVAPGATLQPPETEATRQTPSPIIVVTGDDDDDDDDDEYDVPAAAVVVRASR